MPIFPRICLACGHADHTDRICAVLTCSGVCCCNAQMPDPAVLMDEDNEDVELSPLERFYWPLTPEDQTEVGDDATMTAYEEFEDLYEVEGDDYE